MPINDAKKNRLEVPTGKSEEAPEEIRISARLNDALDRGRLARWSNL